MQSGISQKKTNQAFRFLQTQSTFSTPGPFDIGHIKRKKLQRQINTTDKQIDKLVYDLTEEEIAIVEKNG